MDIAKVKLPSNITKTSFIANWEIPTNALEYLLDVATDKEFTSKLAGYDEAVIIDNYEEITGLSDLTKYYYRVKAIGVYDSGDAYPLTTGDLYDPSKAWTVDEWIGYKLRLTIDTGTVEELDIISNTADTIEVEYISDPEFVTAYEIIQYSGWSFSMEVLTGFFIKGLSMEMKTNLSERLSVSGITFEVKSDTVSQSYIRDADNEVIEGVNILVTKSGWNYDGDWDPNMDPYPGSTGLVNGDFYKITADGDSDITGETLTFTTEDILLYDNDEWQIKVKRNVTTNASGISGYNIDYNENNLIKVSKPGYQTENMIVNYISGSQYLPINLQRVISVIHTPNGYLVNPDPTNRKNKNYL